ncbi:beta-1,3-galactosyltransferase 1-like isoform 2-T2 [Aulostomus maculatus]
MPENSVPKSKKTPWTRTRRCLGIFLLVIIMGIVLVFYISSLDRQWPSQIWTGSWSNKANNIMNTSQAEPSVTEYFVTYPHKYNFIINEAQKCQQDSPFLVLMIPVEPHNKEARDIIRKTWGKETTVQGRVVGHYFLLGRSKEGNASEEQVFQESQEHRDILQSDFLDSYNNLTIKTMLMFEWLSAHCPQTSYAMKIDTDIFLNVHNLVAMLSEAPRQRYLTGLVVRDAPVLRDHNSKWFLPTSAFPESTYPPYALGLGYVFSLDLCKLIVEASKDVKAVYIEDVYVGLCLRHLRIPVTDPPHGNLFRAARPYLLTKCFWTSVITTILQSSSQLSDIWETYQSTKSSC